MSSCYEDGLEKTPTNCTPLTPVNFLLRSADVYPEKPAIIHGERIIDCGTFAQRCRRLASALRARGIGPGATVSVMAPNVPALLDAHFGVPMCGAVLNALNTRLDAATIRFVLQHAETKVLIADRMFADVVREATAGLKKPPILIHIDDPLEPSGACFGEMDYEELLATGDPGAIWVRPADEWQAISLNYTSGTTGNPKGVVYHHRGAYLAALANSLHYRVRDDSVYLWTLPMFHCNGWCFTWGVTAAGGTHVCLRRVEPAAIYTAIEAHGVSHLCGAPVVLNTLINAPAAARREFSQPVLVVTGGAAPPSTVMFEMERLGFSVLHAYGLTESYGPASTCVWKPEWDELALEQRAAKAARQGVRQATLDEMGVFDAATGTPVPRDGSTIGETPCAFVSVKDGHENPGAETIIAFCRDNMAHYKVPKTIVFSELPKTSTGKIPKTLLRERARHLS